MLLVGGLLLILIVLIFLLGLMLRMSKKVQAIVQKIKAKIFWNGVFRFLLLSNLKM